MPQDRKSLFVQARNRVDELVVPLTGFARYANGFKEREIDSLEWDVQHLVGRLWWVTNEAIKEGLLKDGAEPEDWMGWPYQNPTKFDSWSVAPCPTDESEWRDTKGKEDETRRCKELAKAWHMFADDYGKWYKELNNGNPPPTFTHPILHQASLVLKPSSSASSRASAASTPDTDITVQSSNASTQLPIRVRKLSTTRRDGNGDEDEDWDMFE